jgi:Protein of unknown function (DUF4242)
MDVDGSPMKGIAEGSRGALTVYLVDRTLPGLTEDLLAEVQRLLHEAARRLSSAGQAVHYLQCVYLPEDDRCLCLFEANDLGAVRRVNEAAQVPFRRISTAVAFRSPGVARDEGGKAASRWPEQ